MDDPTSNIRETITAILIFFMISPFNGLNSIESGRGAPKPPGAVPDYLHFSPLSFFHCPGGYFFLTSEWYR